MTQVLRTPELGRGDASPSGALPPFEDPHLLPPPATGEDRAKTSPLAITSIVAALLLGPVGAICGVVFGWVARREIELSGARRKGVGLATAGIILGALMTVAWGAALGWAVFRHRVEPRKILENAAVIEGQDPAAPAAATPAVPAPESAPSASVPKRTRFHKEGAIELVDVGVSAPSLGEELAKQRADASAAGQTVLLMTVKDPCAPCLGLEASLKDPLMQTALAKVRLVRVDVDVFREDLDALKIPHERLPGFFLLAADLTPKDGIDGGEWDDDVAANIAPVLGAFLRGKYVTRRQTWQPLPVGGVRL